MYNKTDYDQMMRLLVVGNSSVGKTCLLRRFSEGQFSESFIPTVGIDFAVKNLKVDDKIIKVQIFDTAGQERFKSIISSYFRNADGILIVFDVTDKQTFEDVDEHWLRDIRMNSQENVKLILVGNKNDLIDQKQVTAEMGKKYAQQLDIAYIETSAKTEQGVQEAFEAIVKDIYYRKKVEEPQFSQNTPQGLKNLRSNKSDEQAQEGGSCAC